ncbi:MAG: biopolymer transporter ExbD [Lentisphaerae bacterium]|nr:biopolymer transporter ExbD [Lentisphaerota bacterium]
MSLRAKQRRESSDIDITSLLDVIFLLLIFFMVASSFHEETRALDVTLPRAENPEVITLDENVLSVTVSKDDRIFLNEREVDPQNLKEELTKEILATGFKNLLIKGDGETKYRNIAAVIDAATTLEVEGVSFAVLYSSM